MMIKINYVPWEQCKKVGKDLKNAALPWCREKALRRRTCNCFYICHPPHHFIALNGRPLLFETLWKKAGDLILASNLRSRNNPGRLDLHLVFAWPTQKESRRLLLPPFLGPLTAQESYFNEITRSTCSKLIDRISCLADRFKENCLPFSQARLSHFRPISKPEMYHSILRVESEIYGTPLGNVKRCRAMKFHSFKAKMSGIWEPNNLSRKNQPDPAVRSVSLHTITTRTDLLICY